MKNRLFTFLMSMLPALLCGQHAHLSGRVVDAATQEGLPYAHLELKELNRHVQTDIDGWFDMTVHSEVGLPQVGSFADAADTSLSRPRGYHLHVSHIGCEPLHIFLPELRDTQLLIELAHRSELIDEVVIHAEAGPVTTQASQSIDQAQLSSQSQASLAQLVSGIAGVSSLRNGGSIGKPIVHGLFGNRITILNNGIAQSGQQWGNDHAPEIDPFVADHIAVVKGVAALAYAGSSLGSLILVEPGSIDVEPHLHGHLQYSYQSNGRSHGLNARLERGPSDGLRYRWTGTFRHQGDQRTPDYWLRNTGRRELNSALQLAKKLGRSWSAEAFLSTFNSRLAVFRGSHIGNLTDLNLAFDRDEPFFTEAEYDDRIDAPRQQVSHQFLKLRANKADQSDGQLELTYALQYNRRKEFDVRRGNRSDRPALDLAQWTHFAAAEYRRSMGSFSFLKTGLQLNYTYNENQPGTGVLPIIPDFQSVQPGTYFIWHHDHQPWQWELGGRYDFNYLDLWTTSRQQRPTVERKYHRFHRLSAAAGFSYHPASDWRLSANVGFTTRPPAVNELYSQGLHQGVSGIEEGDPGLTSERSLKFSLATDWQPGRRLFVQLLGYVQAIDHFIYLQPEEEPRLTIRGAFPVFSYQQTDARLFGADLTMTVEPTEALRIVSQFSYLNGQNTSTNSPLIYMPPNRASTKVSYALAEGRLLGQSKLEIEGSYTFRQDRYSPELDFLPPPDGYFLLSAGLSTRFELGKQPFRLNISGKNLLNLRYRDYLNRLRYFADEIGRQLLVGIKWTF